MYKTDDPELYIPVARSPQKRDEQVPVSEFYLSVEKYENAPDVPMWWKRDIKVNLGLRAMLKERKRVREANEYRARKIALLRRQNEQFRAKMKRDDEEFELRYGKNNALLKARLEEAELVAEENALLLEREKLIAEDRLKRERAERERVEALMRDEEILAARREELMAERTAARERNAAIEAEADRERDLRLAAEARRAELRGKGDKR